MRPRMIFTAAAPRVPEGGFPPFDPDERGSWRWTQPQRTRRQWVLVAGEKAVATFGPENAWSRTLVARFAAATLNVRGSLLGKAAIVRAGETEPLARYVPHWLRGGRIEAGSDTLKFRTTGFLPGSFEIRTSDDLPLVSYRVKRGFLRQEGLVALEDAARRRSDLAALIVLGWYLVLMARPRTA